MIAYPLLDYTPGIAMPLFGARNDGKENYQLPTSDLEIKVKLHLLKK